MYVEVSSNKKYIKTFVDKKDQAIYDKVIAVIRTKINNDFFIAMI